MAAVVTTMIEEGVEHPHCNFSLPLSHLDDVGAVHVVYLKVIGLSGILLDSQRTKATVSRSKDMLIPPRQMKASLAVVKGNQVFGISPDSKRLSRILPLPTPTSSTNMADEAAVEQQPHQQQSQRPRPVRRYIAVWDNSTIKTTTKPNGEFVTSTADSTILFETSLISNSSAWKDTSTSTSPDELFEVIVGLTYPATTDAATVTIPIGIASLPIKEAAAMRGSSGKVVLDLPIQNISEIHNTTNPFPISTSSSRINGESNVTVKSKRNIFAVLGRRNKASLDNSTSKSSTGLTTSSKRPCIYTLDTSAGNDSATLRVELELHEKETNVEMGLSSSTYSDEPYTILMNSKVTDANEVVLTEVSTNDMNNTSIETSTHSTSSMLEIRNDDHDGDFVVYDQSIERVLSIRPVPWAFKAKSLLQLSPVRRFRVKSHDSDGLKFNLTPVPAATSDFVASESTPEQLVVADEENDVKTRILDVAIQRILSMQESGDQFDNDDDVPLNKIDVPFDEQSFLSRDTEVIPRKKSFPSKKPETIGETLNVTPPSLNFKPEPSVRKSMIGSIWSRNKRSNAADTSSATISVSGTESSTRSVSNKDSDIESPPRTVKKILLPDVNNMLFSSLIDVSPADHVTTREEEVTPSLTEDDKSSVVKPVSILRNANKSTPYIPFSSNTQTVKDEVGKMDAVSVISSAETEVKKNTKPRVDYEEHFHLILKDLNDEKTPASDGPETDATESMQSSSTSITPPSPDSTYSTSLPSFAAEDTKPVIMEGQVVAPTVKNAEVKTPLRKKREEIAKANYVKMAESTKTNSVKAMKTEIFESPHQKRSILSKRNILTQNLYGLIDIQPCTAKLGQFLIPDDDELVSIDESSINEASTIDTFKTQRRATIHDDLADLGLLWGDMCRQTGFQGNNDDDSLLAEEGRCKEKIGTKQRWIAGLRRWHSHRSNEYDEVDEGDQSQSSGISGGSFTDEHTLRSTTEESESGFSEVGTEVDVNDSNVDRDCTFESSPKQPQKKTEAHTLSARFANRWSKSSIDQEVIDKSSQTKTTSVHVPFASRVSSLPPKAPTSTLQGSAHKVVAETVPDRSGSYNGGGSNTDSATPQSLMPPKSIAQSVVDFVEYVISPSPTSFTTSINNIPTELETDDAGSIGELTATTYERQVEVDEMRRQSNGQQLLTTLTAPFEINENVENESTAAQAPQTTTVASIEKSYFSEYDGTDSLSPEVAAAMEAAAAKQMADVLN